MKTISFLLGLLAAVIIILYCVGCQNLKQKTFRIIHVQQGGVVSTAVDPSTLTITPKVVFGTSYTSITTVPANVLEYECTIKSYSWWSGKLVTVEYFKVKRGKRVK